ncbi:single-stranded DNA-binding protein [Marmoricola sp. URHB0036]|uniref:single-stranded DNA-binding protein n=1 Tax=Marmoricola sp. URHB0036 TaxID=1298863 RepID=UPI0003F8F638|nr:single-stranded DNA-binding protein [Marmoricola sp. URHB0036]
MTEQLSTSSLASGHVNAVTLVGRVSAVPDSRDLPSGDRLVTLRIVVDRPPVRGSTKRAVDVIDVACWSKRTQRTATSLGPDDAVRVEGSLRRRFFATGSGRASRYEVEAGRLARVTLPHVD